MSTNITLESAGTQIFVAHELTFGTESTKVKTSARDIRMVLAMRLLLIINAIPKNTTIQKTGEASQAKKRERMKNMFGKTQNTSPLAQ
ncbi:MAG: hypothetical protein PUD36_10810 [Bacteroidales bacterium]|nr:hypothetical protein [Bacteroidales bacterium]